VERVAECSLPTEFGEFHLVAFQDTIDNNLHLALVKGEILPEEPALVRVHVQNPLCDLTASRRSDRGWPLRDALQRVSKEGRGVVVILGNQIETADLIAQIKSSNGGAKPLDQSARSKSQDLRTIGLGAQILADIGVRKMRVLSAPKRIHSISGFDLEIVEYVT
jgi:3,4-dihydroxy 2-butanone 4-phosphate synthase / GTP cyclohydrolase II